MQDALIVERIRHKFKSLRTRLNERLRRQWAAAEARALGWGGISAVVAATGLSHHTIDRGIRELSKPARGSSAGGVRRKGAGRKPITESDPSILRALENRVEPTRRGDPQSPLRWTCKSTRRLAEQLRRQGHRVAERTVAKRLIAAGFRLQSNRKTKEGKGHPDRDAQFQHINAGVVAWQRRGQPVISVDTKKKEWVGNFKNGGREYRRAGQPLQVRVHDFIDRTQGRAIPYGVFDLTPNPGWVSVGIDHDTAWFATEAIARWWQKMGRRRFPKARQLLITADGGGSNGSRCRLWKIALQQLADRIGLDLSVCHFPPGTSKWNKIEHRLFCHITQNWRGKPLVSHQVIVNLIARTTTRTGLRVRAEWDTKHDATGIKVSDQQLAQVRIKKNPFHGDWNYDITPN
ncbi:MAG: ISAzo13 family transposase [Tepidisphaeraceae bacterium]